ncbi:MAG: N-acetyltransferase DgcN [Caulobacteraceae bacterium]
MRIPSPYLLHLGEAPDPLSVKTARGIADWRPELVVGQYRQATNVATLGLGEMDFESAVAAGAKTLVLGFANAGGRMSDGVVRDVLAALQAGLHVASGLHQHLRDNLQIRTLAAELGRALFDIRVPPGDLKVGDGGRRSGRRLLTVGTDCSVGKMYTALSIEQELRHRQRPADFKATGQTGILIAGGGVPLDAVVGDFLSGAIEQLSPARDDGGWDVIEGQGSLFHPSYAGVSLGLLHGAQPDALVLCHEAERPHTRGLPSYRLPTLGECLDLNLEVARLTNPAAIAVGVALNTSRLTPSQARDAMQDVEAELGVPCGDPVRTGVQRIVDRLLECFDLAPALSQPRPAPEQA